MKALFLTKEYPPNIYGGAGVHVDYLTSALQEIMELEVRCFGEQKKKEDNLVVEGYNSEWQFTGKFQKVLTPLATNLLMVDKKINAGVVHAHTWYTFWAGFLFKKLYNIPLVTTVHSLEPLRPWKQEQLGNGYLISSWMEKMGLENSDRVVAVSRGMKEDILKHYDIPEERVKVIYNGIDLHQYQYTESNKARLKYGIDLTKPYILFVGRITRQKGIIHLLNALKYIKDGVQVVLCAGAPDTEEIKREMTEKVSEIQKIREGVIWINEMVPKEAIIELYSQAAVFVCPSVYEPFGIINLEAMACKTPVVASAVGGIKEVVVDGETGFLVSFTRKDEISNEPEDAETFSRELARKINILLNDEKLQKEMALKGRERVEKYFSWEAIARQTKELYREVINSF